MGGRGGVKYNRHFSRKDFKKAGRGDWRGRGGGGRGGRESRGGTVELDGGRGERKMEGAGEVIAGGELNGRDNRDEFELHGGSFKVEEIKALPEWERRVTQPDDCPKRKYALCVGYAGTHYQGLQINPGAVTVESVLEKALFLAGGILEKNFGNIQKVSWSRTARTDKGVHAIAQCCSMKLNFPLGQEEEFRETLNTFLPTDIRVHYVQKVSKTFNGKLHCSHRRYHYLLPTYLLEKEDSVHNLLKDAFLKQGAVRNAGRKGGYAEAGSTLYLSPDSLDSVRSQLASFRCPTEVLARLKLGLKQYEGTKNYHNFTSNKDGNDASANRYITAFDCGEPFVDPKHGLEWICLSVSGQSFLLNQIRKMVNLAMEYARCKIELESFVSCFSPNERVDIPMAPGLGLYLDELFFDRYNAKLETEAGKFQNYLDNKAKKAEEEAKDSKEPDSKKQKVQDKGDEEVHDANFVHNKIEWSKNADLNDLMLKFRHETIYPHIFDEEKTGLSYMYYLDFLRISDFKYKPQVRASSNRVITSKYAETSLSHAARMAKQDPAPEDTETTGGGNVNLEGDDDGD